jgi:succinate dehydrogenase / fumarate reductase cytochrome b subunit
MKIQSAHTYFFIKRLHSLTGIIPLGLFLMEHFFSNSYAFKGAESFNKLVSTLQSIPILIFIEVGFIFLPLIFHAVLGLIITYMGSNNFVTYSYARNWLYFFQRVTGVLMFVFIIVHVWSTRISTALEGREITFSDMQRIFAPTWAKWFYVVGILSAAYHLSNGISSALITWGITVSRRSQRIAMVLSLALFVVMGAWGIFIMRTFSR